MPWCPKCWEEYPKDFTTCHVCDVTLTEAKPEGAKPKAEGQSPDAKKRLPRYLRRARKTK